MTSAPISRSAAAGTAECTDDLGEDEEGNPDEYPPWRELVQAGWNLLRPGEPMSTGRDRLPQLAATGLKAVDHRPLCFPDSPLVTAALDSAMTAMWGRDWIDTSDPSTVPAATMKPRKWVEDYRRRFYGDSNTQEVPIMPPKPSSEENSLLKKGSKMTMSVDDVVAIENLTRHALSALGTVDWLFGTLRKMSDQDVADPVQIDQTWAAATRALRHGTQWAASSVALSVVARRKAFLASSDIYKVPERAHTWLQYQPLPVNLSSGLFGNTMATLRTLARDEGQARLLSMASRSSSFQSDNRTHQPFRDRSNSSQPSQWTDRKSEYSGRGFKREDRGRGRSRRGFGRGTRSGFTASK